MNVERRKNKRLDLDVSIQLERLEVDDVVTVKYLHVDVTDLSRGGLGFKSKQKLEIGTYYYTKIQIWTKEVIDAVVEIVRCQPGEDVNKYGCIFVGMSEIDTLKIDIYQMFNE